MSSSGTAVADVSGTAIVPVYPLVMLSLALLGFVVNIASIILIGRRKQTSMFHALLKVIKS